MKVITAIEEYDLQPNETSVFLAGGITNCPDWQSEVIKELEGYYVLDSLVVFNPRRDNFPIGDKNESFKQIEWEFKYLEKADIFSIYFTEGISDQPICMYELGRNIVRMQMKYPASWKERLVITVEKGYKRSDDVYIQSLLACGFPIVDRLEPILAKRVHAQKIMSASVTFKNMNINNKLNIGV